MTLLSVLIPTYNYDIRALAEDLKKSIEAVEQEVEVIFADDASDDTGITEKNFENVSRIPGFRYLKREENLGYCENRNDLGRIAKGELLLFLDSDVRLTDTNFIKNWLRHKECKTFICGGNVYQENVPQRTEYILKWKHGKEREEAPAFIRNKQPHLKFWASNFLVPRELFLKVPFDRKSKNYGYNDTVYAYLLMKSNIPVLHIDNPVLNTGLMSNRKFIERTREAVNNLTFFEKQPYIEKDFRDFISLLKTESNIRKIGLVSMATRLLNSMEERIIKNLLSDKPHLRYLDLLKLLYLLELRSE